MWQNRLSDFYQSIRDEDPLLVTVPNDIQMEIADLSVMDLMGLQKVEEIQINTIRRSLSSASEFYSLVSEMMEMDTEFEYQFAIILMILYAARKQNSANVFISTETIDLMLSYMFSPSKSNSIISQG